MNPHEKFLFDLNGFLVVRGVFTAEEVAAGNAAAGTALAAAGPRMDLGGMLGWQEPHCRFFRDVLTHPTLVPYYCALLGEGYRLDHQPQVIAQDSGSEGFVLHGGPLEAGGRPNRDLHYACGPGGHLWTSLLAA